MSAKDWKPITEAIPRKVLVTNNLKAMNAYGWMSHVWLSEYVHQAEDKETEEKKGKFYDLYHAVFLTHYCEIPQFHPTKKRLAEAARTKKLRGEE